MATMLMVTSYVMNILMENMVMETGMLVTWLMMTRIVVTSCPRLINCSCLLLTLAAAQGQRGG